MPKKMTKEDVKKYAKDRAYPGKETAFDILSLLNMAGTNVFPGVDRAANNIMALPAYLSFEKDFSTERKRLAEQMKAIEEYQKQERPIQSAIAEGTGLVGGSLALAGAAPAIFAGNIGRSAKLGERVAKTAKAAGLEQLLASLLGREGVWEKSQVEGELLPSATQAYNATPQALEEVGTATFAGPIFGEALRVGGKVVQKGAESIGLDNISKYLSSESAALKRAGLSPDDVEAGRLVSGTANIPGQTKKYAQEVGQDLTQNAKQASVNLSKAQRAGIPMTSAEAYAPTSNVLADIRRSADVSPDYTLEYGKYIQKRPEKIAEAANKLRPEVQAAKDKMYGTVVGEETMPSAASTLDPITGKQILQTKPMTVGELNQAKEDAYTLTKQTTGQEAIAAKAEADRLKQLLRSTPEGRQAETLYGIGEDIKPLLKKGGIDKYAPTKPYTGEVNPQKAIKEGKRLLDVADILAPAEQKGAVNIATSEVTGKSPATYLRTPSTTVRGNFDVLGEVISKLTKTPQKYYNKLSPTLIGQNLPDIAKKAPQFQDVFKANVLSAPLGVAAGLFAAEQLNPEVKLPPRIVNREATLEDFTTPQTKQGGISGAREATLEDFGIRTGVKQ